MHTVLRPIPRMYRVLPVPRRMYVWSTVRSPEATLSYIRSTYGVHIYAQTFLKRGGGPRMYVCYEAQRTPYSECIYRNNISTPYSVHHLLARSGKSPMWRLSIKQTSSLLLTSRPPSRVVPGPTSNKPHAAASQTRAPCAPKWPHQCKQRARLRMMRREGISYICTEHGVLCTSLLRSLIQ